MATNNDDLKRLTNELKLVFKKVNKAKALA